MPHVLTVAETLYPGYFALVMATGALSIALYLLQHEALAYALFALNVLAYGTLWALLAAWRDQIPPSQAPMAGQIGRTPSPLTRVRVSGRK